MLRISSFNINGIRAVHRRGFTDWLTARRPDVIALQEVRCPVDTLPEGAFAGDRGYHAVYDAGRLAGRNGVAILTRMPPASVRSWGDPLNVVTPDGQSVSVDPEPGSMARGLREFASEGRYVEVDLADVPLTVASLYLPKGGLPAELQQPGRMREAPDGGAKHERKLRFMDAFARQLAASRRVARSQGREFLLMGDLNIAHQELDVVNARRQTRNEGFLPVERDWIDGLIGPRRLVDVLRQLNPGVQGPYSWWSWLGNSFTNDTGWRIDYHLATPGLARTAVAAGVDRDAHRDARMSDHAPVTVDYEF